MEFYNLDQQFSSKAITNLWSNLYTNSSADIYTDFINNNWFVIQHINIKQILLRELIKILSTAIIDLWSNMYINYAFI